MLKGKLRTGSGGARVVGAGGRVAGKGGLVGEGLVHSVIVCCCVHCVSCGAVVLRLRQMSHGEVPSMPSDAPASPSAFSGREGMSSSAEASRVLMAAGTAAVGAARGDPRMKSEKRLTASELGGSSAPRSMRVSEELLSSGGKPSRLLKESSSSSSSPWS